MFRYLIPATTVVSLINISIAEPDATKTYSGDGSLQETTYTTETTTGTTNSNGNMRNDSTMDHNMTGDHMNNSMHMNDTPKMPMEGNSNSPQTPMNTNPSTTQDPAHLDGVTIPGNGAMEGQNPMAHDK